jgi:16S rRNA (uracil1498-N3)-methyltransferase
MRRFFLDGPLAASMVIRGQDARHIGKVLRLKAGDEIAVVAKDGQAGRAVITAVGPTSVSLELAETLAISCEPPVAVWLAQGLPKGDKLEFIIQKAVEIGAAGIIPMATAFSTVQYHEARQKSRLARWRKVAEEAAKQCGRTALPTVTAVKTLTEVLAEASEETAVIMLYEGQTGDSLQAALNAAPASSYLLLVGPEGGFSQAEADTVRARGGRIAGLGPRILRTETASLAVLSILMYEKGDLGSDAEEK